MYKVTFTIAIASIVVLVLVAAAANIGFNILTTTSTATQPPIIFSECDAQLVTGLNRTSGVANATATQSKVDIIPYCCFEDGFDGWRYWDSEGDGAGAGVLRGYYDSANGYATPGSVILAAENAPSGFTGYNYVLIPFNYTWSDPSINAMITFAYRYYTYIISSVTGTLYVVIADENLTVIWYQQIDSRSTTTSWTNVTINATGILPGPGQYYLVLYVSWSAGGWGFTNTLYVYLDDVHYYVWPPEDVWYGCVLHVNVTDSAGYAWIVLENASLAPDVTYIDLYIVNGVYSSTHIIYDGTSWTTNTSSQIPVNSSDNLLDYVDVKLLFRASGTSTQTSTLDIDTCFLLGGVRLCGVLRVYINR